MAKSKRAPTHNHTVVLDLGGRETQRLEYGPPTIILLGDQAKALLLERPSV